MMTNKETFLALCKEIHRDGIDDLVKWLESSDFFTAPASTKYHGNYEEGLLQHSLNVFDMLLKKVDYWKEDIPRDSILIVSLFHDLCKANFYVKEYRNCKVYKSNGSKCDSGGRYDWESIPYYKIEDQFPVGHGEKSVIIMQRYIRLTNDEITAIRWHMGPWDNAVRGGDYGISKAYEVCPLAVMLHMADMEATYLVENT